MPASEGRNIINRRRSVCIKKENRFRDVLDAEFDLGLAVGRSTHGCRTVVLGGSTRSRIGFGVTFHEAM